MKSSYTFVASAADTDYQRICRENHQARFLIVKSESCVGPITFVRMDSQEHYDLRRAGQCAVGRIDVPPKEPREDRGRQWLLFEGDHSKLLAPKVRTTVEVY